MQATRTARRAAPLRIFVTLLLATGAAGTAAACGFTPVSPLTITPASVTLPLVADGSGSSWPTAELTASFQPGVAADSVVTWTSADPSVAHVSPDGVVSGVAPGRTTVTATFGSSTATSEVCVGGGIESVDLSPASGDVPPRDYAVTATVGLSCGQDPATAPLTYRWECETTGDAAQCQAFLAVAAAGSGSSGGLLTIGPYDDMVIRVEVCLAGRCAPAVRAGYWGIAFE